MNEANGFMNMTTNIAILLGLGIGGPLLQWNPVLVGFVLVLLACIGLGSSLLMRGLEPVGPDSSFRWTPYGPYVDTLKLIRKSVVWDTMLVWSWFYAAAIVVLAVIPGIACPLPRTRRSRAASVGLGVGIGCLPPDSVAGAHPRKALAGGGDRHGSLFMVLGIMGPSELLHGGFVILLLIGVTGGSS